MTIETEWLQRHQIAAPHVVILGLGAGHHVNVWLEANPQSTVTVIETKSFAHDIFQTAYPDIQDRVKIVVVGSMQELRDHAVTAQVVNELCPVLMFQPAMGAWRALYEEYFRFLTGRSREGMEFFLDKLGFTLRQGIEMNDGGRLLTIKDLGLVVDTQHMGHPRAAVVRVLRELVL